MAWVRATISSRAFATAAARRDFASAKGAAGVALRSTVTRDPPCGDRDGWMARSVGESDAPAVALLHGQGADRLECGAVAEHGRDLGVVIGRRDLDDVHAGQLHPAHDTAHGAQQLPRPQPAQGSPASWSECSPSVYVA